MQYKEDIAFMTLLALIALHITIVFRYKCKEKFVILQSIGRIIAIKSCETGLSSTPADILVGNLIPNSAYTYRYPH